MSMTMFVIVGAVAIVLFMLVSATVKEGYSEIDRDVRPGKLRGLI